MPSPQDEADAAHGLRATGALRSTAGPQPADVGVERVVDGRSPRPASRGVDHGSAPDHVAGATRCGGQMRNSVGLTGPPGVPVRSAYRRGRAAAPDRSGGGPAAPGQRVDADQQLGQRERFGDEVVTAIRNLVSRRRT